MTSMATAVGIGTVRAALVEALKSTADFNSADVVGPVAVLWPDEERAWAGAVEAMSRDMPVLSLGEFDPDHATGPVPWLRIELANQSSTESARGQVIVYLPGVGHKGLTDAAGLPEDLQPLAGIVVRSAMFCQRNGSDWTPWAFLTNETQGLGLSVAGNHDTKEALTRGLARLLDSRVSDLRGRTLDSSDFDRLLVDDPTRQLLLWLDNPASYQKTLEGQGTWTGFVSLAKKQYKVDLVRDGALKGAQQLGDREGKWAAVWNRFTDAPQAYPGVVEALRAGKPEGMFALYPDSWPQDNEDAESAALGAIEALGDKPVDQIRKRLTDLNKKHQDRLHTVWSTLGQTPIALLVDRLNTLADLTISLGSGTTVTERADAYAGDGWRADRAFLSALATLQLGHASSEAVERVAESLYRPWLEALVATFQAEWVSAPPTGFEPGVSVDEPVGTCALFVDGLRYDVAADLSLDLTGRGLTTDLGWGLAGVPTVTATCKPAVSPVDSLLTGGPGLSPAIPTGSALTQESLKKLMSEQGWSFISDDSVGDPTGRGWTESGNIDLLGHKLGVKLSHQIPDQVRQLSVRIAELLNAGWQRVVVVTDHGWLMLPGKLPKHHLPEHLTEVRKGRCARLSEAATPPAGINLLPWRWDPDVQIALAPGIHAFEAGKVYEHGGLSPQESVVPRLVVTKPDDGTPKTLAIDCTWVGLTLRLEIRDAPDGCSVDIRGKANDGSTSLAAAPKPLKGGKGRLMVDDESQGQAAVVVVLGPDGTLLASSLTQIPEG